MVPWHSVSAAVQAGEGLGRGQAIRAVMLAAALEAAAVSSEGVGGDAGLDLERGQWAKEEGGSIINQALRLCSGRARRSVFDSRSPVHQVRLIAEEVAWTEELLLAF
mmetsp:Transcript_12722/g.36881  ORF Transcript_12722/g.36881 Transcript_12722/m.36881 type:complete len:107 (-) Transcript_12722:222-542(-)